VKGDCETQIAMECPVCQSRKFEVYFTGGGVLPRGSVWVICVQCRSYWTGDMLLENGTLKEKPWET